MTSCLIYVSKRARNCSESDIQDILSSCQQNNTDLNITGVLLYSEDHFVQYLEGDYDEIFGLYKKIRLDSRHTNITLVLTSQVKKRLFPSWQMGSRKFSENDVTFDTSLDAQEAEWFNAILSGKTENEPRIIRLIQKFFR